MARYPLNLPVGLKQTAEELAAAQGVSLNQFILWAVAEKVGTLLRRLDDPDFPHVTYRRGASGHPVPVIRGTGIRVQTLAIAHNEWGLTPSQIAADYDLEVTQVNDALDFYQSHQDEIDSSIAFEEELAGRDVPGLVMGDA